jgi:tetratricopeptide (TPR) repeat protein
VSEVRKYSPILADRVAVSTAKGLEFVIAELSRAMRTSIIKRDYQRAPEMENADARHELAKDEVGWQIQEEMANVARERRGHKSREKTANSAKGRQVHDKSVQKEAKQQPRKRLPTNKEHAQVRKRAEGEWVARRKASLLAQFEEADSRGYQNKLIELGERILKLLPDHPPVRIRLADAYVSRGVGLARKGNHKKAISDYNRAIQLVLRRPDYYYFRGLSHQSEEGRSKSARSDFLRAAKMEHVDAKKELGPWLEWLL